MLAVLRHQRCQDSPPGIVLGTLYTTPNAVTAQAQTDLTTAYNAAASAVPTMDLTGVDLGFYNAGNPLGPGVYFFSSSAGLTGNLTLDGGGDPNAEWIFQIGSSLTTATNATVSFVNGATPCHVFWQVGSSATIQTNNTFGGTIMALTDITLNGGTLHGRALARNGAVTISAAEYVNNDCSPGPRVTVGKVADRAVASAGDVITYTYAVANSGPVALTVNSVIDTRLGDITADFIAANGGSAILAVGASISFIELHTVLATDPSPLTNSVTVEAGNGEVVVSDTIQASVTISEGRRCFLPVTLTQEDWHNFSASAPGVPGGLIYNKFPSAFATYGFFGTLYANQVIIGAPLNVITGGSHSITFTGTTMGLTRLSNFLPQIGPADRLWGSYINPSYLLSRTGAQTSNALAGEVLALTLNIAYNDMRLMPRSRGYDLELFILTQGVLKGKTVGQVWNIADAVLAGASPIAFGLPNATALVSVLHSINANYEFVSIDSFIDRGYLTPNVPLGQPGPPHPMIVPF